MNKSNQTVGGSLVALIAFLWLVAKFFIDAANFPSDTANAWRLLLAAPFALPLALFVLGVAVLGWSVWQGKSEVPQDPLTVSQVSTGLGSHNFAGPIGSITLATTHVGPKRLEMDDQTLHFIAQSLDCTRPVSIVWHDYGRTVPLKSALEAYLSEKGFLVNFPIKFHRNSSPALDQGLTISKNGLRMDGGALCMLEGCQVVGLNGDIFVD